MEKHTDPTTVALIEGRDKTEPEYRAHYVLGVAKATANITRSRIDLIRRELDRMNTETGPTASGVAYITGLLDEIDQMHAQFEAVAS